MPLLTEAFTILLLLANWSSDKERLLSLVYLSNAPFGALPPFGYLRSAWISYQALLALLRPPRQARIGKASKATCLVSVLSCSLFSLSTDLANRWTEQANLVRLGEWIWRTWARKTLLSQASLMGKASF
jgi:hypothetical protein